MAKLTSKQANALAKDFLGLAQATGDFRFKNWDTLTKRENQKLSNLQWSMLNVGEDILAFSTTLVMDDVKNSLTKINTISSKIRKTIKNLENIQKGIDVATAIVTLGAAIISKNPRSIVNAIDDVITTWSA